MDNNLAELYTVGHSSHPIDYFIKIIKKHNIEAVADVRSSPYSQYTPQFNRENFAREFEKYRHTLCFFRERVRGT